MVNKSIAEIEQASYEQADAIEQVREGLAQVSSIIQTNAAGAEENSSASKEMAAQAATLHKEIGRFNLSSEYKTGCITDDVHF